MNLRELLENDLRGVKDLLEGLLSLALLAVVFVVQGAMYLVVLGIQVGLVLFVASLIFGS